MFYLILSRRLFVPAVLLILFQFQGSRCRAGEKLINAGGGISFFVPRLYSDLSRFSASPNYHFFIEKPELFYLSPDSTLVITPGVSYINFSQNEGPGTALGGGGTLDLQHYSFSPYMKVIYSKSYMPEKIFRWYYGVVAGVHLYTKSKGERSWWMMQGNGYITGNETIDSDASDFFNLLYMGIITGFTPKVGENPVVKPAFEISFSPNFINITGSPVQTFAQEGVKNVVMFSVILGL